MTKAELIKKLHSYGETWANEHSKKQDLENYLMQIEDARSMSSAELFAMILNKEETR